MNNSFYEIQVYNYHKESNIEGCMITGIIISILFVVCIILFFVFRALYNKCSIRHESLFGIGMILSVVFGVIFFGVGPICIAMSEDMKTENEYYKPWYESEIEEVKVDHIYSLDLQQQVSGGFVLGCGYIQSEPYYYYYLKTSMEDTYRLSSYKITKDTYVKESDATPRIVERKDANSDYIYTLVYVPYGAVINPSFKN